MAASPSFRIDSFVDFAEDAEDFTGNPGHIRATQYAPAYESKAMSSAQFQSSFQDFFGNPDPRELVEGPFEQFNCFHVSPSTRGPVPLPTLDSLKQHAQAVCLLIRLLQPSTREEWPSDFPAAFQFLKDLEEPWISDGDMEHCPELINRIPSVELSVEDRSIPELINDANAVFALLHQLRKEMGGILSIPAQNYRSTPAPNSQDPTPAPDDGLAKWIGITQRLKERIPLFQEEVAYLQAKLASEVVAAGERSKHSGGNGDGVGEHRLSFPQDRYVLAGLSDGLWIRLNEELRAREREDLQDEAEAREEGKKNGEDFDLLDQDDGERKKNAVSWIEVTSRLYRVPGQKTVFVIPGFGSHPKALALHRTRQEALIEGMIQRRDEGERKREEARQALAAKHKKWKGKGKEKGTGKGKERETENNDDADIAELEKGFRELTDRESKLKDDVEKEKAEMRILMKEAYKKAFDEG